MELQFESVVNIRLFFGGKASCLSGGESLSPAVTPPRNNITTVIFTIIVSDSLDQSLGCGGLKIYSLIHSELHLCIKE